MSNIIRVKAGSDIDWQASWLVSNVPQDLTNFDIICQIRSTDGVIRLQGLVTKANQTTKRGSYQISFASTTTSDIEPAVYDCDIRYHNTVSDQTEFTQTFLVEVFKNISSP